MERKNRGVLICGVNCNGVIFPYKEQTNEKISSVIEKKRIDHACRLLDTTDMTINEIALASGYALTHTFRVAFKKVQGVTPLEWKKAEVQ